MMKKTRKKIGAAACIGALLITAAAVTAVPENRCGANQLSTEFTINKKQNSLNSNIMIFKNCIDYFSDLSKIITR